MDSPINWAHQQERQAEALVSHRKFAEAIVCHRKALGTDIIAIAMQ